MEEINKKGKQKEKEESDKRETEDIKGKANKVSGECDVQQTPPYNVHDPRCHS
jgi:hypothetical protein